MRQQSSASDHPSTATGHSHVPRQSSTPTRPMATDNDVDGGGAPFLADDSDTNQFLNRKPDQHEIDWIASAVKEQLQFKDDSNVDGTNALFGIYLFYATEESNIYSSDKEYTEIGKQLRAAQSEIGESWNQADHRLTESELVAHFSQHAE